MDDLISDRQLLEAIAKELRILGKDGCLHDWGYVYGTDYCECKKCGEHRR